MIDSGEILQERHGVDMPIINVDHRYQRVTELYGDTYKRKLSHTIPAGKTISVAYNKGPYMIVDAKDFKTMGKKV